MSVSKTPLQETFEHQHVERCCGYWEFHMATHFLVFEVTKRVVGFWRFRVSRIGLIYNDWRVRSSVKDDSS